MHNYIMVRVLVTVFCLQLLSGSVFAADTKDLGYYVKQMVACRSAGNYKGGLANANKAVQLAPQDSSLYNIRGYFKMKTGDTAGAIKDATESIKFDSKNVGAYELRASVYLAQEKWTQAAKDGESMISLSPKESDGYYVRGSAKFGARDIDGAVKDIRKAVSLDPGDPGSKDVADTLSMFLVARARQKATTGNMKEAIQDCEAAIGLNSKNTEAVKLKAKLKAGAK